VTIDVGTGDGRAVLATAAREPTTLVIGLDANAAAMAESSRRAARPERKGGPGNALFLVAAAEAAPRELTGIAHRVTVRFPWGSLLRGCLGADPAVAAGVAALLAPGAQLELLLAPANRDVLHGLPTKPDEVAAAAIRAFAPFGFRPEEARVASAEEVRTSGSTWARRLFSDPATGRHVVAMRLVAEAVTMTRR
jgi:16S rRNA (adenine(1408)-N(1))-methyltransferase